MTVRDSRKFVQKFVRQKIAKFGKFARRICSEQIFEQKKIIWAIFRQAIEGSKFAEKFAKFPPHRPYRQYFPSVTMTRPAGSSVCAR